MNAQFKVFIEELEGIRRAVESGFRKMSDGFDRIERTLRNARRESGAP
jgi:hypothetical protein